MNVWWSVGLSALSVFSTWLVGNKRALGWLLALGQQVPWAVYAVMTGQWGFLGSCAVFTVINARNFLRWRRDDRALAVPKTDHIGAGPAR